jgi:hypothetical protein
VAVKSLIEATEVPATDLGWLDDYGLEITCIFETLAAAALMTDKDLAKSVYLD